MNRNLFAVLPIVLSGCVTGASAIGMTPSRGGLVIIHDSEEAGTVSLEEVSGGSRTDEMWTSQVSDEALREALTTSLRQVGLLADGQARYGLSIVLVSLRQQLIGFDMTVTAAVWCKLVDRTSGAVVWQDMIAASHTAQFGEALAGVARLRLANEGAMRKTIAKVIGRLDAALPRETPLGSISLK